jgi:plasmid stabilization system protein ParE
VAEEVIWSARSVHEFELIIKYLEENWSVSEVVAFIRATARTVEYIREHPRMFRKSSKRNLREALITPHNLMIYHFSGKRIEIVSFWDTRKNPKQKTF